MNVRTILLGIFLLCPLIHAMKEDQPIMKHDKSPSAYITYNEVLDLRNPVTFTLSADLRHPVWIMQFKEKPNILLECEEYQNILPSCKIKIFNKNKLIIAQEMLHPSILGLLKKTHDKQTSEEEKISKKTTKYKKVKESWFYQ